MLNAGQFLSGVFRFGPGLLGFSTTATFVRGRNVSRRITTTESTVYPSTFRTAPQTARNTGNMVRSVL
jgi:hypothetical protein